MFRDFQEATILVLGDTFAWVTVFFMAGALLLALLTPLMALARRAMNL